MLTYSEYEKMAKSRMEPVSMPEVSIESTPKRNEAEINFIEQNNQPINQDYSHIYKLMKIE